MRFAAYGILAGLILGWFIRGWYEDSGKVAAIQKRDQHVATQNLHTQTRTAAAATHIQAIHAHTQDLHRDIARAYGDDHATAACDPFADPFRLLYDAGSAGQPPGQAHDLLP